ncbi:MAG: cyclic nucleotide-binding domain-containing protein [Rhodospirillales bacterium]|jgi:CRP/FNR family transcriptional regulator, cyclic AMP receptor protein|nr:cyclic nucleotide-binding domain-containing protein [Rhodospirillales bacterium]
MTTELMERRTYQTGALIFKQGDSANNAYVVQEGSVEIFIAKDDGVQVLATIPKGGIFGEMALIDDTPRMASARMGKGGTVVIVNRSTIDQKLAKTDPFIRTLLNIFVQTIRRLSDEKTT